MLNVLNETFFNPSNNSLSETKYQLQNYKLEEINKSLDFEIQHLGRTKVISKKSELPPPELNEKLKSVGACSKHKTILYRNVTFISQHTRLKSRITYFSIKIQNPNFY